MLKQSIWKTGASYLWHMISDRRSLW
jgi:hypothetical protein